jgi:methionyl-tRNA synthetase
MSHPAIVGRINTELANDLGNLAQRTFSLIARNCAGMLPGFGAETEADNDLLTAARALQVPAPIGRVAAASQAAAAGSSNGATWARTRAW